MAAKLHPELDIWVYPLEAVKVPGSPPLSIVDHLRSLPREKEGERGGDRPVWWRPQVEFGGVVSGTPESAYQPGRLFDIRGLQWWDFKDPVTGAQVGGFTLAVHRLPWCTYIKGSGVRNAVILPTTRQYCFGFRARHGRFWSNVNPDDEDADHGAVAWYCSAAPGAEHAKQTGNGDEGQQVAEPEPATVTPLPGDEAHKWAGACYVAQSIHGQPPAQSFVVKLWLLAPAPETQPWVRIGWEDDRFSVLLQEGLPPVLSVGYPGKKPYWRRSDIATEASASWFGSDEPIWVGVFYIAGRIVVRIWGGKHDYTLAHAAARYDSRGNLEPRAVDSRGGRITVCGAWAPIVFRMYEVLWGQQEEIETGYEPGNEEGVPAKRKVIKPQGSFRRRFYAFRRTSEPKGYALGAPSANPFAWKRNATVADRCICADVTAAEVRGKPGLMEYRCTLRMPQDPFPIEYEPHLDGERANRIPMRGARTPFVHSVVVRYANAGRRESRGALNVRPAVRRATETVEDPMLAPGPRWELTLSREVLPDCELEDGRRVGDAWPQYLQRYHPVRVDVRWRYDDGTASATYRRLEGYVWRRAVDLRAAPSAREATVELRDWSMRLQKPAGVVDGRFAPLDILLLDAAARRGAGARPKIYGAECVRYILETALGPEIAGKLEYVYPDAAFAWELLDGDVSWLSLLDYRIITGEIPSAGFFFPPPWGRSVLDWIRQIADLDVAVFFFSGSLAGKPEIVPVYGNYFAIVKHAPMHTLYDVHADEPLQEAEISQVSEHDINRILVWGRFPHAGEEYRSIMPALGLIAAEARIESGSPIVEQNINATWERTLVKEGTQYWLPRVAQIVAHLALKLYRGVEIARYVIRTRGIEGLWWGHKVVISSTAPGADPWVQQLVGREFRVMRINNTYDLERGMWESRLSIVPQPNLA